MDFFKQIQKPAKYTAEVIEKRSVQTGRKHSEETKRKLSAAGRGKTISEEQKQKISAMCKGSLNHKSVAVHTPLGQFDTLADACEAYGKIRHDTAFVKRRCKSDKYPDWYYVDKKG